MADRDFAQLQATARPPDPGMSGPRMGFLVLGIVAVVIAGFVGGYELGNRQGKEKAESAAKARLVAQIREQQKELVALRKQHAEDKAKAKAAVGALPANSDAGDLTFYTDLPKQPVKPEPLSQPVAKPTMSPQAAAKVAAEQAAPAKTPSAPAPDQPAAATAPSDHGVVHQVIQRAMHGSPSAAAGQGYYVQVASFRDTQAAAKVKAKLTAIGLHARLKRAEVPNRGTWYRLQVGPYGTAHDAAAVRLDIEQKARMKGIIVHEGG